MNGSVILENAIEAEKAQLLQVLEGASGKSGGPQKRRRQLFGLVVYARCAGDMHKEAPAWFPCAGLSASITTRVRLSSGGLWWLAFEGEPDWRYEPGRFKRAA